MTVAELSVFLDVFNKRDCVLVDPMDWQDDPVYVLGLSKAQSEDGTQYVRFDTKENSKGIGGGQPITIGELKGMLEDYPADMVVKIEVLDSDGVYVQQKDIDPYSDYLGFDLYLEME